MEPLKRLKDYPDVSFIEGISFTQLQEQMIRDYESKCKELTGKDTRLAMADPYRLILYSCAVSIYQGYQYGDKAGKMGLLKYSTNEFLDNLAALKKVKRNQAEPARTTIRFTLAETINKTAVIPLGTRIKGLDLYFETSSQGEIQPGELYTDIDCCCQTSGIGGNGYLPGDIRTLVDPLPYTLKAENITATSGGADMETDHELAERIYLSPSSYSTAGPEPAYEYWVKTYSQAINECRITSEAPGEVDIYIMVDGDLPTDDFIKRLSGYLRDSNIRPLTDYVVVKKPEVVNYDIECTYYINNADRNQEETIKAAAETACLNFASWQKKIGRDITPSRLIYELMQAGVQSVNVTKPEYAVLSDAQVGLPGLVKMTYGGLRDG